MTGTHEAIILRAALDGDDETVERMVADLKPRTRDKLRLAADMIASSVIDLNERTGRD